MAAPVSLSPSLVDMQRILITSARASGPGRGPVGQVDAKKGASRYDYLPTTTQG